MPPLSEVLDALTHAVLPAAVVGAVVFTLVAKLAPSRVRIAAGALALAAGFLAGNALRGAIEFRLDPERPLTPAQLADALHTTFVPPPAEDEEAVPPPSSWYWLPWTAGIALAAGVVARTAKPAVAWPIRGAAVITGASLAVAPDLRSAVPWLIPLLAAVMLGEWAILERLGEKIDEGGGNFFPVAASAVALFAAAAVLLHAHTARLADVAVILGSVSANLAAVGWSLKADSAGTAPAVAVVLPALLLSGRQDTFSDVPATSFALVALAPLALGPLLVPRVRLLGGRAYAVLATALLFIPVVVGVGLAMRAESLSFG